MQRRSFLSLATSAFLTSSFSTKELSLLAQTPEGGGRPGERLARAARTQLGITRSYDPRYIRLPYPGGDVPRSTGVCADVIVRAGREGLGLDLQTLLHEDMAANFSAYPKTWGMRQPDSNIDQRRVLNLEVFWRRKGCEVWRAAGAVAGDAMPGPLAVGDILTWRLQGRLPHVGIVVTEGPAGTRVVHNWGNGAEESPLSVFQPHRGVGHYRWPRA